MLLRASFAGAFFLLVGRLFGAGREFILAREVGPTDELAMYVLASTTFLAVAGLVSGVASALVLRQAGSYRDIRLLCVSAGVLPIVGVSVYTSMAALDYAELLYVFALSIPFYGLYGVANGRLLKSGASFFGILASTIPAVVSTLVLLVPLGTLVQRAAWGNLAGAVLMAVVTECLSRTVALPPSSASGRSLAGEAVAISIISSVNIASPIIDRFFASGFGPQDLVLLNLGAIIYVGATTSLGLAMGNAAVSRESIGASGFSPLVMITIPLLVGACVIATVPSFSSLILLGTAYSSSAPGVLSGICLVYALAMPCAISNQINMRLWNLTAKARAMLIVAFGLLFLNVSANLWFISQYGVVGIAMATFTVQVVQVALLGFLRNDHKIATISITGTVFLGGLVAIVS